MEDAACVVGWYGKLPLSREFIRRNAAGPEVLALDQWMQEGLHWTRRQMGPAWRDRYEQAGPWHFVFFPEGSTRCLVGTVAPGRDRAGREFPFFLFLRLESAGRQDPVRWLPVQAAAFLNGAVELAASGWTGLELAQFVERLDALEAPDISRIEDVRERYEAFTQRVTMGEFWTAVLGDFSHPGKYVLDLGLMTCLDEVRRRPSTTPTWPLRFPMMADRRVEAFDIPFWLDLGARWMGDRKDPSLVLWPSGRSARGPAVLVAYSGPSPRTVAFWLSPDEDSEEWYDLAPREVADAKRVLDKLPEERRALLENPDLPLAGYLAGTPRSGMAEK